jgi:antitoxin component HigA of HigAB toxin-antitoxin module
MEESGTTTADLGRLLGNSGLASQIMLGRRELSKSHIRTLSQHFKLDAGYFL